MGVLTQSVVNFINGRRAVVIAIATKSSHQDKSRGKQKDRKRERERSERKRRAAAIEREEGKQKCRERNSHLPVLLPWERNVTPSFGSADSWLHHTNRPHRSPCHPE